MEKFQYECLFIEDKNINLNKLYNDGVNYKLKCDFTKQELRFLLSCNEFKNFSSQFYLNSDIDIIIDEKDVRALQSINPMLFHQYSRSGILNEFEDFLVRNITKEQFMFFPQKLMKNMCLDTLQALKNRFSDVEYIYKGYIITNIHENKKIIAFQLEDKFKVYFDKIRDVNHVVMDIEKNIATGEINKHEIENYLDITGFNFERNREPLSRLEKIPNRKSYFTQSFLDIVKSIYVPAIAEGAKMPSTLIPEDGLYKIEKLLVDYNISKKVVSIAIANGELGCYRFSPRKIRVSSEDFEDYIDRKLQKGKKIRKNRHTLIEEKIDEYVDSKIIFNKLEISEKSANNLCIAFYEYFKNCYKYYDKDGNLFYKKADVSNTLKKYYGVFENSQFKVIECPHDMLYIEDFYSLNEIKEIFNISSVSIRTLLKNGLPCINFNKDDTIMKHNQTLIRKDDINRILKKQI